MDEIQKGLNLLMDYYNLLPNGANEGLSPFEMGMFKPIGPNEKRLREAFVQYIDKDELKYTKNFLMSAEGAQAFSDEQAKFFDQKDDDTGKKRWSLILAERKKTKKDYENGLSIWMGFIEFRNRSRLSEAVERFSPKSKYSGTGRNEPCPCGAFDVGGKPKKYKRCHGA